MEVIFCHLIVGLFIISLVTALEIPEGCSVKESINESNLLYDTFDFYMLNNLQAYKESKIVITCQEDNNYYQLYMNSSHGRITSGSSLNEVFSAPNEFRDWKGFQLGLTGKVTLRDDQGESWFPVDHGFNCTVKNLIMSNAFFMRLCPQKIPTWVIQKGTEQKVMLLKKPRQHITLISRSSFNPVFDVSGSEFRLRMGKGGAYVIGSSSGPLASGCHKLSLEIVKENSSYNMRVFDENGKQIISIQPTEEPTNILVNGAKEDSFVVVTHIEDDSDTGLDTGYKSSFESWILITVQILIIGTLVLETLSLHMILKPTFFKLQHDAKYLGGKHLAQGEIQR